MSVGWILRSLALVFVLALLGYALVLSLQVSPPDAQQGNMARAFYYHFPDWIGASVFLPLNLVASVVYLAIRSKRPLLAIKADSLALASAEMGVVFCGLGLVTGSLWGRVA
jgi:heme exporter protein C